jgi:hypothetical protein
VPITHIKPLDRHGEAFGTGRSTEVGVPRHDHGLRGADEQGGREVNRIHASQPVPDGYRARRDADSVVDVERLDGLPFLVESSQRSVRRGT